MRRIGVGVIGASLGNWASTAHLPALRALDEYELRALATSRQESADAAAEAFGVPTASDDYRELVANPEVELVVVAVKVPDHFELISAALAAGKNVVSEWPLAVDAEEAEALRADAASRGVRTAVTLQGRFQAAVRYARDLVADGYVGRVMSSNYVGSGIGWVPNPPPQWKYLFAGDNGVTTLAITGMHALDTIAFVLGEPVALSAHLGIGHRRVRTEAEVGGGELVEVRAPDQVAIAGRLEDDAVLSCFFRGGVSRAVDLHWEINGTEGDLRFTAPGNGNVQNAQLTLFGGRGGDTAVRELAIPGSYEESVPDGLVGPPRVYARLYQALARDFANDSDEVPDFGYATARHRIVDGLRAGGWSGAGSEARAA